MQTAPNIESSSNLSTLGKNSSGTVIDGIAVSAIVQGNLTITGSLNVVGAVITAGGAIPITEIAGTPTLVPYFDATGFMGTDLAFSFDDIAKTLSVAGNITSNGVMTANTITSNSSVNANAITAITSVTAPVFIGNVSATTVNANTSVTAPVFIGNVSGVASTATYALYAEEQYADATGTSDVITANFPDAVSTLKDGYRLTLGIPSFNATTTPTFAPTLGGILQTARFIHKFTNNVSVPLAIGDLQGDADLRYDLPNTVWILMNPAAANGATGGAGNPVFYENDLLVTANYTITTGKNAMTAGPITINAGIIVNIPAGSMWSIV